MRHVAQHSASFLRKLFFRLFDDVDQWEFPRILPTRAHDPAPITVDEQQGVFGSCNQVE